MPDVNEGLTSDVDSDAGFMAALAEAANVEVPEGRLEQLASEDRSISRGLEDGRGEQPRDDQGRFAARESEAQESSEGESDTDPAEGQSEAEEPGVDPAVTTLLEQHGGDANAALAALLTERTNAQSLIGRQGNELGETRERLARLEGQLETLIESGTSPSGLPGLDADDETVEQLESLYERFGARGMMDRVIEARPDLIETAIEVWNADDPLAAQRFAVRYDRALEQERQPAAAVQADPFIDGLRQQAVFSQAVDEARQSLSIGEEEWTALRDHVIPAFEDASTSSLVKKAIVSDDADDRRQGMEDLLQIARARAVSAKTTEAAAQATQTAAEEAAARKAAATVTTGSLRPAERQPGEATTKEEAVAAFHKSLLDTETTSVEEGLRQGKAS